MGLHFLHFGTPMAPRCCFFLCPQVLKAATAGKTHTDVHEHRLFRDLHGAKSGCKYNGITESFRLEKALKVMESNCKPITAR